MKLKRKFSLEIETNCEEDEEENKKDKRKLVITTRDSFPKKNYFNDLENNDGDRKLDPLEVEWNKYLEIANKNMADDKLDAESLANIDEKSKRSRSTQIGRKKRGMENDSSEDENELYSYLKRVEQLGPKPIHLFWFITGSFNMGKITMGSDFAVLKCKRHYLNKLKSRPKSFKSHFMIGKMYIYEHKLGEAMYHLFQALKLKNRDPFKFEEQKLDASPDDNKNINNSADLDSDSRLIIITDKSEITANKISAKKNDYGDKTSKLNTFVCLSYFCLSLILKNNRIISYDEAVRNKPYIGGEADESKFQILFTGLFSKFANICSCFGGKSRKNKDGIYSEIFKLEQIGSNSITEAHEAKIAFYNLKGLIEEDEERIDYLWLLLELSIAYHPNVMKESQKKKKKGPGKESEIFVCPDPPQEFATRIKIKDDYYGYLAWSEIYMKYTMETDKADMVLNDLSEKFSRKPEAHIKLWKFYYKQCAKYRKALEVAEKLFIMGTEIEISDLKVTVALIYAKSLFKNQRYDFCFDLLQSEFSVHPDFPVILFEFGKKVAKSSSDAYYGSAIGALQECLRLFSSNRGHILFWMGKLYELNGNKYEAFLCWKEAVVIKCEYSEQKLQQMKTFLAKNKNMAILHSYHLALKQDKIPETMNFIFSKKHMADLRSFDEYRAEVLYLRMRWRLNPGQDKILFLIEDLINKYPGKFDAYFLLWEYYKMKTKYASMLRVTKKMIINLGNSQVPTNTWVEIHLLHSKSLIKLDKVEEAVDNLKNLYSLFPDIPIESLRIKGGKKLISYYLGESKQSGERLEKAAIFSKTVNLRKSMVSSDLWLSSPKFSRASRLKRQNSSGKFITLSEIKFSNLPKMDEGYVEQVKQKPPVEIKAESKPKPLKKSSSLDEINCLKIHKSEQMESKNTMKNNEEIPEEEIEEFLKRSKESSGYSVSSDPKFLYYIAKYCYHGKYIIKEGMQAIEDYISINKFLRSNEVNSEKVEIDLTKGRYYKALYLLDAQAFEEAFEIFQEICFKLFELGLRKKSNHVSAILRSNLKDLPRESNQL